MLYVDVSQVADILGIALPGSSDNLLDDDLVVKDKKVHLFYFLFSLF